MTSVKLRSCLRLASCAVAICGALLLPVFTPSEADAAASAWVGREEASARLITAEQAVGSGPTIDAALEIKLAPGWHAYWRDPGAAGLPPSIDWKGSQNLAHARMEWPAPHRFPLDGLEAYGYAGRVVLPIALTLTKPGEPLLLHATLAYSACRTLCVPLHADLTLALPQGAALPGPEAPLIATAEGHIPRSLHALGLSLVSADVSPAGKGHSALSVTLATHGRALHHPDLFVEGVNGAPGRPNVTLSANGREATLAFPRIAEPAPTLAGKLLRFTLTDDPARAASFSARPVVGVAGGSGGALLPIALLASAVLGGLILNVMPCVLPVLGLKLMGLARLAGAERNEVRGDLLATAIGVIGGFALLAGALIGLKQAGAAIGWGIQFQQPWFLAAMTMVMALFAADLWGWITIELPAGAQGFLATRRVRSRRGDAFLTGILATLLATSCSAPFVGTAVGFALGRGSLEIVAIFLAMGVGMALPYLAVTFAPGLALHMPKPGPWMVPLRVVLGLLLVATAIWLLWVLGNLGEPLEAVIVGLLAALLLGVLALRRAHVISPVRKRLAGGIAGALIAAGVFVPLAGAALIPRPAPSQKTSGIWQPFARAAIAENVADGHTVFVNVTADWCLICKVNELGVFDRDPIAKRLAAPGVIAMQADWTRPEPTVTHYLESFGRYGVPLDVVYGPGAPQGIVLPELVTSAEVLNAFERARAKGAPRS